MHCFAPCFNNQESDIVIPNTMPAFLLFFSYFFFLIFMSALVAYASFQAKGQIRDAAADLHHSHSKIWATSVTYTITCGNARSDP